MDENVPAAISGLNEAEAFGGIEPFHGAIGHVRGLLFWALPATRGSPAKSVFGRSTESRMNGKQRLEENNNRLQQLVAPRPEHKCGRMRAPGGVKGRSSRAHARSRSWRPRRDLHKQATGSLDSFDN